MEPSSTFSAMNREIFNLNLEVEATSLYLLCCGIADTGEPIAFRDLLAVWNESRDSLEKNIDLLEKLQILAVHKASERENETYTLLPAEKWKR
jgi:hypothetical protein